MELQYELPLSKDQFEYLRNLEISQIDRIVTTSHANYQYSIDPVGDVICGPGWISFVEDVDNMRSNTFDCTIDQPIGSYLDSNGTRTRGIVKFSVFLNSPINRIVKAIKFLTFPFGP